ncbi:hypothetical protein AB4Z52_25920 [Rhizobium sp. 2YAF20]|uniref:hypothetical protein n=1 Tax=Rhizobium sp. 2YAF20 TaxID=3233027 RepID=UPI003F9BA08C
MPQATLTIGAPVGFVSACHCYSWAGMRGIKDEILGAVSGIRGDLGGLNECIARMHKA